MKWWKVEIEDDNFLMILASSEIEAINEAEDEGHTALWAEEEEEE